MNKEQWMSKIRVAKKVDKFSWIVSMCANKVVLDVGCVGQDRSYEGNGWLHGELKKVAQVLIGTDINQLAMGDLKEKGYEIYLPDELPEKNQKFDVIVMGDVIEHVNDPGAFLAFYAQFLNENGQMIICTPNVFGMRYIIQVLFYGKPGTNEEHTLGFDPYVMLELFNRIDLAPKEFYWLREYRGPSNWKQRFIMSISSLFIGIRKYFNANFMFVVARQK